VAEVLNIVAPFGFPAVMLVLVFRSLAEWRERQQS